MSRPRARLLLCLLALSALTCKAKNPLINGCRQDEDCSDPKIFRCNLDTGQCLCRTNDACKAGEFCNAMGYCQAHVGCYETQDCPAGFFCDPISDTCIADGRCASDLDCPPGELCDKATSTCKAGCRVDGDCNLRELCVCAGQADGGGAEAPCGCTGTTDAERESCPLGRCVAGSCLDNSWCGFSEACKSSPAGGLSTCQSDFDATLRPYCANCVDVPGGNDCGPGPNFCLFSTYTSRLYCGVDCSQGQQCANGYDCKDVIVVWTRTICNSTDDCTAPDKRTSLTCDKDEDCPNHGLCGHDPGAPVGFCYGRCTFHEGANESFCSCVADEDCAQDACDPQSRSCSISRKTCDPAGGGCRKIRCVDFGDKGGCLIGQNCKPLEGLTCSDVGPH
jgi:hypothetical protein